MPNRIWINQSPECRKSYQTKKSCNHENKPIQEPRKVGRETVTWTLDVCLNQANNLTRIHFIFGPHMKRKEWTKAKPLGQHKS
jgi:hypothetical protein